MTRPTNLFILFSGIYLMNRAALKKNTSGQNKKVHTLFLSLQYLKI